jgi:hypothetical protein
MNGNYCGSEPTEQLTDYYHQSINRPMKNQYIINLGKPLFAQTKVINGTVSKISERKTSENTAARLFLSSCIYTTYRNPRSQIKKFSMRFDHKINSIQTERRKER